MRRESEWPALQILSEGKTTKDLAQLINNTPSKYIVDFVFLALVLILAAFVSGGHLGLTRKWVTTPLEGDSRFEKARTSRRTHEHGCYHTSVRQRAHTLMPWH